MALVSLIFTMNLFYQLAVFIRVPLHIFLIFLIFFVSLAKALGPSPRLFHRCLYRSGSIVLSHWHYRRPSLSRDSFQPIPSSL